MSNLAIYEKVRKVPQEAQKAIQGGRLKGMTDINPMWRIKALTEQFGVCGFGWKYEITDKRLEHGANNEVSAFVDINLFIKMNGEWSEAIPGTGGSAFISNEKGGTVLYTSDECFKMALTDAISVACKALGFGADVYWDKDRTKYYQPQQDQAEIKPIKTQYGDDGKGNHGVVESSAACQDCKKPISEAENNYSLSKYGKCLCRECQKKHKAS